MGTLIVAGVIMCTTPAMPVIASDAVESVQEIISDNEIDSLVSDPDKVVDIIMYVKDAVADQDISDDQIKSIGSFEVPIKLHKEVTARLSVKVVEA